jgi:UDP-N-acetylglucosamine 4-epimerase
VEIRAMTHESLIEKLSTLNLTWLITGVAGFIGSNMLELLLSQNQKVIGIDNFSTGSMKNLEDIQNKVGINYNNFKLINGTIEDYQTVLNACQGVDVVLHQAALGSVPRSIDNPIATNGSNVVGFLNVITAAKNTSVKKFIYASSSSVYGDSEEAVKVELLQGKPLSPYALTKVINEEYATIFAKVYGFESVGLRYFNVFGPRQNPAGSYAAVIPTWITKIINNENCSIFGNGENTRDFTFVSNVVQANILAVINKNLPNKNSVFNIAASNRVTLNELHSKIASIFQELYRFKEIKNARHESKRAGDILSSLADISEARRHLGYEPNILLDEGLKRTIEWYFEKHKCQM